MIPLVIFGFFVFWLWKLLKKPEKNLLASQMSTVNVVGESAYQDNLNSICGGKTKDGHNFETVATLIPEPHNKYDKNAVNVQINGLTVGYLSKHDALRYKKKYGNERKTCNANICGGWDRGKKSQGHYGVKLNIDM